MSRMETRLIIWWTISLIAILVTAGVSTATYMSYSGNISELWSFPAAISEGNIIGYEIGDVTGDGLNDVMIQSNNYAVGYNNYILRIYNGKTGAKQWEYVLGGPGIHMDYMIPLNDVNGDGYSDLGIFITNTNTKEYMLQVRNGNNGNILWADGEPVNLVDPRYLEAGNINGDGNNYLIYTVGNIYPNGTYYSTTKMKRGSDGSSLWEFTINPQIYSAESAGDLNGDGFNDILITMPGRIIAKKGSDGSTLWEIKPGTGVTSIFGTPLKGDATGDGKADILLDEVSNDLGVWHRKLSVRNGVNGAEVWGKQIVWSNSDISLAAVEDLNGDGLTDVIFNTDVKSGFNITQRKMEAFQGNNGGSLWQYVIAGTNLYSTISPTGDVNGDGGKDILINYNDRSPRSYISRVVEGSNGILIWQDDITGANYALGAFPAGDLNGDGVNDIIENKISNTQDIIGWRLTDKTKLWDISSSAPNYIRSDDYSKIKNLNADVNGDKTNDLLTWELYDKVHMMVSKKSRIPGDVNDDGFITTSDALLYLRYSVGQNISPFHISISDDVTCEIPPKITTSDALLVLRKAVGQNVNLKC